MKSLEERLVPLISERFLNDERYRQGHIRIVNALDGTRILGVHIPKIRDLAKEINREGNAVATIRELSCCSNLCYEEKLVWGQLISIAKIPLDERLGYIEAYVPVLANWAECDTFCCGSWAKKLKNGDKQVLWDFLDRYWKSRREFEVRFAVIVSMACFLDEVWIDRVFERIEGLDFDLIVSDYPRCKVLGNSPYYVRMGVAWLLATALCKFEVRTREFVGASGLPDDVKRLYVRKARESFRTKNIPAL